MRRLIERRPSPAMAVAFVALLAALTGTAVALPGTNTVNSGDIVNNTIRSKDIRNGTIVGKDVRNGRLTGADVQDNSLTGADINEGTLGTVPNANHANTANSANTANTANSANTASSAGNASTVDGKNASDITMWAVVNSNGTLARGFGLTSTTDATGEYYVTATRRIDNCAAVASPRNGVGDVVSFDALGPGHVADPNSFNFHRLDGANALTNASFSVAVHC